MRRYAKRIVPNDRAFNAYHLSLENLAEIEFDTGNRGVEKRRDIVRWDGIIRDFSKDEERWPHVRRGAKVQRCCNYRDRPVFSESPGLFSLSYFSNFERATGEEP